MELIKNTEKTDNLANNIKLFSNKKIKLIKNKINDNDDIIIKKNLNILKNNNILTEITLNEVSYHDNLEDCWIVIYDRVYDVTKFLSTHPGGLDTILDCAGRDATIAFRGTGHSKDAIKLLNDYVIGELPMKEKLFRKTDADDGPKIFLSDIPE